MFRSNLNSESGETLSHLLQADATLNSELTDIHYLQAYIIYRDINSSARLGPSNQLQKTTSGWLQVTVRTTPYTLDRTIVTAPREG